MSDKDILERLKSKDPQAFKELVEQYQKKVINICYRFLRNREEAENVAQEVFIQVYKSINNFREQSQLSTWIHRIAVTKSLDVIRKEKRKKRFGYILSFLGIEKYVEQIPDPQNSNPKKDLEKQERSQILRQAIDSLAENQKIAITLSKYEEFSNKEIAEIMGTTISAVESLLNRAKVNLLKILNNYYENNL